MRVLVTGGAGYIGSHVVAALGDKNCDIVTYDNFTNGHRDSVLYGDCVFADLQDRQALDAVIQLFKPDAVIHFAAFIEVGESVQNPLKYYENNAANTLGLMDIMVKNGVDRLIFSSTAAVYGNPMTVPISEKEPIKPINPYGEAKAFIEKTLADISSAKKLRYVALRYFNASGADPKGRIGERHNPESHLIPLVLKTAKGERDSITVFGADYPTADGTCVRDYVHVTDLAQAHVLALEHLMSGGRSEVFNCGYGHGFSVKNIIDSAMKVTGRTFMVEEGKRRPGDPALLIADSTRLKSRLGWIPEYDDLEFIIRTAWEWESRS